MSQRIEIATAIGTIGCALGIGLLMQSGEVAELRYGTPDIAAYPATALAGDTSATATPSQSGLGTPIQVASIALTSAGPDTLVGHNPADLLVAASTAAFAMDEIDVPTARPPRAAEHPLDCAVDATARTLAGAMVAFSLSAPCLTGERVTITHDALSFSDLLSDDGTLHVVLPALSSTAQITAQFHTGHSVAATVSVTDIFHFHRFVLQWEGHADLQLHAREAGAAYGDPNHVWAGAIRDASAMPLGNGYLTVLGNPALSEPQHAEIYTFPVTFDLLQPDVALSIEAEVTAANCGQDVQAQALEFRKGKRIAMQHLSLAVPDCDAIGRFLVLNNPLQDLTVASK